MYSFVFSGYACTYVHVHFLAPNELSEGRMFGRLFFFWQIISCPWSCQLIPISRFEIFQDASRPEDLRWDFVQEFLSLPTSFFAAGAAKKFRMYFETRHLCNSTGS